MSLEIRGGEGSAESLSEIPQDLSSALLNPVSALAALPVTMAQFQCLAINVTGPGIGNSGVVPRNPQVVYPQTRAGNGCTYRGIMSPAILPVSGAFRETHVDLSVPVGERLVQVLGSTSASVCNGNFDQIDTAENEPEVFELGRAFVPSFQSDLSVSIANAWNPSDVNYQIHKSTRCACFTSQGFASTTPTSASFSAAQNYASKINIPQGGARLGGAVFRLKNITGTAQTVRAYLYPDNGGTPNSIPTGSKIASSDAVVLPDTAEGLIKFDFGGVALAEGVYWVGVYGPSVSGLNAYTATSGGSYATGSGDPGSGTVSFTTTTGFQLIHQIILCR